MDALHGIFLLNNKSLQFNWYTDHKLDIPGAARKIEAIKIQNKSYYIIGINNDFPILLLKNEN